MRLKYYLRGIGLGIIFATLIMTVSTSIHNNYLSKEKIIQEARKLGMIMPGEDSQREDLQLPERESQTTQEKENSQEENQDTTNPEETESENQGSSNNQIQNQQNAQSGNVEIILEQDSYISSHGGKVVISKSSNRPTKEIVMTIEKGATSEDVSEVLYQCGYIESREAFNQYMATNGYNVIVRTGEKIIEAGSTYEEIARILLTKYEDEN